jgi:hypothetical protein
MITRQNTTDVVCPVLAAPQYRGALRTSGRAVVEPRDRISHGRLIPNWRGRRFCTTTERPTGTILSPEAPGTVSPRLNAPCSSHRIQSLSLPNRTRKIENSTIAQHLLNYMTKSCKKYNLKLCRYIYKNRYRSIDLL